MESVESEGQARRIAPRSRVKDRQKYQNANACDRDVFGPVQKADKGLFLNRDIHFPMLVISHVKALQNIATGRFLNQSDPPVTGLSAAGQAAAAGAGRKRP